MLAAVDDLSGGARPTTTNARVTRTRAGWVCGLIRTESKLSGVRTTTSAASTHAASAASSAITTKRAIVYVFLSVLLFKPRTAHRRAPNQHSAPSPRLCACAPMGHRASTSLSHHHARPCPPPTSPPTSPGPRPPYPTARLAYPIYPYSASCLSPYIPRDLALRDHRDRRPAPPLPRRFFTLNEPINDEHVEVGIPTNTS